jgi:hypothetical protein
MDMTYEEYVDFINHLFLERLADDDYFAFILEASLEDV